MKQKLKKMAVIALCTLQYALCTAQQTPQIHWVFNTGYTVERTGNTAIYTPDSTGWVAVSSRYCSTEKPYFRPNESSVSAEDCYVSLQTGHKWELKQSGDYICRITSRSDAAYTNPATYADGSTHVEYYEFAFPTTGLTNVKLQFAIADGQSSSSPMGVVLSTDSGTTWTQLADYICANHWKKFNDAEYVLGADNHAQVLVRVLIQTNATSAGSPNFNLKYVRVLADDHTPPTLMATDPAEGAMRVLPTGKVALLFSEKVQANGTATLTKDADGTSQQLPLTARDNKVSIAYANLDLSTAYTLTVAGNQIADLGGNAYTQPIVLHFTTSDVRPIPSPVLESTNRLWYHRPAAAWEEQLPLGNGRLGAMVAGSVAKDTIPLNEDTFWNHSPNQNHNANALRVLAQVRQLIFSGQYEAAQLAQPGQPRRAVQVRRMRAGRLPRSSIQR